MKNKMWNPSEKNDKNQAYSDNNDELIIEENTIYEIDLDCYECLQRAKQEQVYKKKEEFK